METTISELFNEPEVKHVNVPVKTMNIKWGHAEVELYVNITKNYAGVFVNGVAKVHEKDLTVSKLQQLELQCDAAYKKLKKYKK